MNLGAFRNFSHGRRKCDPKLPNFNIEVLGATSHFVDSHVEFEQVIDGKMTIPAKISHFLQQWAHLHKIGDGKKDCNSLLTSRILPTKQKCSGIPQIFANSSKDNLFEKMASYYLQVFCDSSDAVKNQPQPIRTKRRRNRHGDSKNAIAHKKLKSIENSVRNKYLKRSPKKINKSHRKDIFKAKTAKSSSENSPEPAKERSAEAIRLCHLVLGGMRIRDHRQQGPAHPMCGPFYLKKIALFRRRSRFVPICDPIDETAVENDWLQNLTAKLTKARRQHSTPEMRLVFDGFCDEPRFPLDKRNPFRTFSVKYAEDGRKLVGATETDFIDYDGIFSLAKYNEKASQLDSRFGILNTQFAKVDDYLVFKANIRHVFLFRVDSAYGDVNNSKRDMYDRLLPSINKYRTHGLLLRDLLEWSATRGTTPNSYVPWDYRDPYENAGSSDYADDDLTVVPMCDGGPSPPAYRVTPPIVATTAMHCAPPYGPYPPAAAPNYAPRPFFEFTPHLSQFTASPSCYPTFSNGQQFGARGAACPSAYQPPMDPRQQRRWSHDANGPLMQFAEISGQFAAAERFRNSNGRAETTGPRPRDPRTLWLNQGEAADPANTLIEALPDCEHLPYGKFA